MIAFLFALGLSLTASDSIRSLAVDSIVRPANKAPNLLGFHGWVAAGGFPYYGYDPGVNGGWVGRLEFSFRKDRWLAQADIQILTDDNPSPLGASAIVQAGWLPVRMHNLPDIWVTTGIWSSPEIEADVQGDRDRLGPTVGFQTLLPLVGMDNGEVRFSLAYSPMEGALYKAMDVGWDVGPLGLRAGGTGLRTAYGRLFSAFSFEICHRW
jgi:hypothetical protein